MTAPFIEHLASEIAGLKQSGLYKAERVITSPQAGTIVDMYVPARHLR